MLSRLAGTEGAPFEEWSVGRGSETSTPVRISPWYDNRRSCGFNEPLARYGNMMDSPRRHGLGLLVSGSLFIAVAVGDCALSVQGRVAGLGFLLFMCVVLVCGGVAFGKGCDMLRRAKEEAPGITWFAFLRDDLIAFALIASLGASYWLLPQSVQESIRRVMHELIELLHAGKGGRP
jgi:hypothetical protein